MSVDRRSRRLIVRLYLFPLLASVAVLITLAFVAGVMARPLIIPAPTPEPIPPTVITIPPLPTSTPFGPAIPSPLPPPSPTPFAAPGQPYIIVLASSTPLRAGPGVHYPTLRLAMRDDWYFLLGISEDKQWWRVRLPGEAGDTAWIERRATIDYDSAEVKVEPNTDPLLGIRAVPGKTHVLVMTESTIREGPGITFLPIQVAAPGRWFRLVGESQDGLWWAVSIDGLSGQLGWLRAETGEMY